MKRRLLIYMDRYSGQWVLMPNCANVTLDQVKQMSASEAIAICKPGVVECITPGKTYHSPDRQGLLRDLQWAASQFLKSDWYWQKKIA